MFHSLADLLFTAVLLLGLVLLYFGIARTRAGMSIASGAVFGLAALIKPALIVWPVALPVIWWLFARAARVRVRARLMVPCIALQLVFIGAWTVRNGLADGCFTPSIIGPKNLRYYVAPRVEAWSKAGHMPSVSAIRTLRDAAWKRDDAELAAGTTRSAEIVQRQYAESLAVIRANPAVTLRVYLQNIKEGLTEGWSYLPAQLPSGTPMRKILDLDMRIVRKVQVPCLQIACGGMVVIALGALLRRDHASRSLLAGALALVVIVAVFVALSGTTFWTGSRILYPCEFALIILPIGGVLAVSRLGIHLRKKPASLLASSGPIR